MTTSRSSLYWQGLWPVLVIALLTPWSAELDQRVTSFFYIDGQFTSHPIWSFLYHYGILPAWGVAILSLVIYVCSYLFSPLKRWRLATLFLLASLAIGPGLIVHAILKDHWGRPRPRQVIEYGGHQEFRAYYEPNFFHQPEPSKSFPCGHCSMGFYFFTLALLGRHYRYRSLYYLGMGLALGLGTALSFIRIAQGGHFLFDTLLSALIMWLTTLTLYYFFFKSKQQSL